MAAPLPGAAEDARGGTARPHRRPGRAHRPAASALEGSPDLAGPPTPPTPLQIERRLTLAFEEEFRSGGEKPLSAEVVEAALSSPLDELEPRLTRHGYSVRTLSEQFNAKPAEIKRLMRGEPDAARTRELAGEMRAAGLPL